MSEYPLWMLCFAAACEITLLPCAGILLLVYLSGCLHRIFSTTEPHKSRALAAKPPILLLHGSGFNESEWVIGRGCFLNRLPDQAVYSMNYAGYVTNEHDDGIDTYAGGPVRTRILKICKEVGTSEIVLIGHSLGGLVAAYYAEYHSRPDGIAIQRIVTIASPWHGSPLIHSLSATKQTAARYDQMRTPTFTRPNPFLMELVQRAMASMVAGDRTYACIGSDLDWMVPDEHWLLARTCPSLHVPYLGHYAIILSPTVWRQIVAWRGLTPPLTRGRAALERATAPANSRVIE